MANPSWVQDKQLYLTVVGGSNLKRTHPIGKQDSFVRLEYGGQKFQTRTCKDGDKDPTFGDSFTVKLIVGIPEISFEVWSRHLMAKDALIGSGKIRLKRVISDGFDDRPWGLLTDSGRTAGGLNVIMSFEDSQHVKPSSSLSTAAVAAPFQQQFWQYCPPFLPYASCLPQPAQPAIPPHPAQPVYNNVYYPPQQQQFVAPAPPQQYVVVPPPQQQFVVQRPQQVPAPPYGYAYAQNSTGQQYQPCPPTGASYSYGYCQSRGY